MAKSDESREMSKNAPSAPVVEEDVYLEPVAPLTGGLALLMALLMPGAGHFFLGRRVRGAAFFTIILTSLLVGVWLDGGLPATFSGSPLAVIETWACMGVGIPYFILRFVAEYAGEPSAAGFEYGQAFIRTAGLMNLLLLLDVLDLARGRKK